MFKKFSLGIVLFSLLMTTSLLEGKTGKSLSLYPSYLPPTLWVTESPFIFPADRISCPYDWIYLGSKTKKQLYKTANAQINIETKFLNRIDFGISPSYSYNAVKHVHTTCQEDVPLDLDVQLTQDLIGEMMPEIKVHLGLNIPCGKYDRGKQSKLGTDLVGTGNWRPTVGICFSKLFLSNHSITLSSQTRFAYLFSTPVTVVGNNPYFQSSDDNKFKIYPRKLFVVKERLEFNLTKHLVWALDLIYEYRTKTRFLGPFKIQLPRSRPSTSFSVAPAIEYNFNENIGMSIGGWFVLFHKNYPKIKTYTFSLSIYSLDLNFLLLPVPIII